MPSNVIPFLSAPRTPPSGMVRISAGTVTTSTEAGDVGQFLYILTFVDPEGGELSVWDGSTHAEALAAAREWEAGGSVLVDETAACVQ